MSAQWSSMKDEEILIPQDRLQLAPNSITDWYSERVAPVNASNNK